MIELTEIELKFIEKMERTKVPNKIEAKALRELYDKIKGTKTPYNCFCSSSSRENFKRIFFKVYEEYKSK